MHKVCNIRDMALRANQNPREMWAAYVRDLDKLMEYTLEGGLGSVNSVTTAYGKQAA